MWWQARSLRRNATCGPEPPAPGFHPGSSLSGETGRHRPGLDGCELGVWLCRRGALQANIVALHSLSLADEFLVMYMNRIGAVGAYPRIWDIYAVVGMPRELDRLCPSRVDDMRTLLRAAYVTCDERVVRTGVWQSEAGCGLPHGCEFQNVALRYCVIPAVLDRENVQGLRTAIMELAAAEDRQGTAWRSNGNQRIFALLNKGREFVSLAEHSAGLGMIEDCSARMSFFPVSPRISCVRTMCPSNFMQIRTTCHRRGPGLLWSILSGCLISSPGRTGQRSCCPAAMGKAGRRPVLDRAGLPKCMSRRYRAA